MSSRKPVYAAMRKWLLELVDALSTREHKTPEQELIGYLYMAKTADTDHFRAFALRAAHLTVTKMMVEAEAALPEHLRADALGITATELLAVSA